MLGASLYFGGRVNEAREVLERAVASGVEDDGAAALTLGYLYADEGRYREAVELLERARDEMGTDFTDQDLLDSVRSKIEEP